MPEEELSSEEYKKLIIEEMKKCSNDYIYCLRNYGMIPFPGKGEIPFDLYDYQEKTMKVFEDGEDAIILKARQLGLSTLVAGFIACNMIFNENYEALVVATKQRTAKNLVRKVKVILKNFPNWLKTEKIETDNKQQIILSNNSSCTAVTSSDDAGRSESLSLLVIDEAAHISNAKTIWTGASETLSQSGGQAIVLSTPFGTGNWYHLTWVGAEEGNNNFVPIKLPWFLHPQRDEKWKKKRVNSIGKKQFAQEHGCSFLASGDTFIDGEKIKILEDKTKKPIRKDGKKDNLWIWKEPDKHKSYLVTADTADSGPGDFSAAHVIDLESCEQVAEFKGHINVGDFGHFLVDLSKRYNHARLIIERNSMGIAVIQPALDRDYENLFWSKKNSLNYIDPVNNPDVINESKSKNSVKPGFATSRKTRPLVLQKLEDYLLDDSLIINSKRTTSELYTFIWKNGKPQAMSGYHDDLVMSLSIGLFIRDTAIKLESLSKEADHKRMSWIAGSDNKSGNNKNTPNLVYTNKKEEDPYKMDMGDKGEFDLRQLLNN